MFLPTDSAEDPYTFEGPVNNLNTPFTPDSATTVLNGIGGWFGVGSIGDMSMSGVYSHAKNCKDNEEYWYKYEESYGSLTVNIGASVGPSFGGVINNIKGAIEGLGLAPDVLQAIFDTMNAPATTVSFSYIGNVSQLYQLDEGYCPTTEWYTSPYQGGETYALAGSVLSFENDDIMFEIGNASCNYTKIGYTSGNSWNTYYTASSSIRSSWRIGENGSVQTDPHVNNSDMGPLATGEWCTTDIVSP